MNNGIDITDEEGNVVGKSKLAAKIAVENTAISRIGLGAPLMLPAFIMVILNAFKLYPSNMVIRTAL